MVDFMLESLGQESLGFEFEYFSRSVLGADLDPGGALYLLDRKSVV